MAKNAKAENMKNSNKDDKKNKKTDKVILEKEEKIDKDLNTEETEVSEEDNKKTEDKCESVDKKEYDKVKNDYENTNNKLLRLQADFLNFKTRTEKEKVATYGNAVADVITDMLPSIDNLERAIDAIDDEKASEETLNFKKGVKMVYDQLMQNLSKKGLKEIEALDSKFNPNLHSGIAFESVEDKEEDTIIEVFQKGYTVNDKVIRPSMVKIAK